MFEFLARELIVILVIFLGSGVYFQLTLSQNNTDLKNNKIRTPKFLTDIVNIDEKDNTSFSKNFTNKLYKDVKVHTNKLLDIGQTDYYDVIPGFRYLKSRDVLLKKILINKCCPQNFYFDTDSLRCLQFKDNFLDFFSYKNFTNIIQDFDNATKYIFIEKVPDCQDDQVLSTQIKSKVKINSNGIVIDGKLFSEYCIQENNLFCNETVVLTCTDARKFCKKKICLRKCCPLRQSYGRDKTCQKLDNPFSPQIYDLKTLTLVNSTTLTDFGIIFGDGCGTKGKYFLEKDQDEDSYFGHDGFLYVPTYQQKFSKNEFCLEYVEIDNSSSEIGSFLCFVENVQVQYLLLTVAFSISCFSLFLTFIVYLYLPKFQNCYGKSLMCYVACLFTAYLCLAIVNSTKNLPDNTCTNIGYTILFSFLAAFFWLNVMAYDIWKTFSSDRTLDKTQSQETVNWFLYYSLYAWTFPSIITTACAVVNQWEDFPYPLLQPHLGEDSCWFCKGTTGIYFFFIIPISFVMTSNIVFYIQTALNIWKVKSEIGKMEKKKKKKFIANKDQFKINGKLLIVMGITWSLEIVSFFVPHPIWYITDTINALHGVFIFAIFLLKKKVIEQIQQKMRIQLKKVRQFSSRKTPTDNVKKSTNELEITNKAEKSSTSEEIS